MQNQNAVSSFVDATIPRPALLAHLMSRPAQLAHALITRALQRARALAIVLYACAVLAVAAYPKLARRTFVDENAFLVGATRATFDVRRARDAQSSAKVLAQILAPHRSETTKRRMDWIARALDKRGFESYASPATSGSTNTHAIARAARGDGRECVVLLTPLGTMDVDAEAATIGLALQVFETVGRAEWLAKDLIWLAVDGEQGEVEATMAWLKRYYSPSDDRNVAREAFERAGAIQQAFAFSAPHGAKASKLLVKLEGWNGAYPNQDIFTMFDQVNALAQGRLQVTLDDEEPAMATNSYHELLRLAMKFMWRAANGIPSGAHAAFKAHSIDAMSIHAVYDRASAAVEGENAYYHLGRLLEETLRACNNLVELLHHSCFYYIMLGPNNFLSIAEYIAPQVMLLVSLTLVAAQLTTNGAERIKPSMKATSIEVRASHAWFAAILRLSLALTMGVATAAFSLKLHSAGFNHASVTGSVVIFMVLASHVFVRVARAESDAAVKRIDIKDGLMIVYQDDWVADKVINIAWLLAVMSACTFFNFALALFVSFALVPACLLSQPTKGATYAIIALVVCSFASLAVIAHIGAFPMIDAFGLLAEHHARWGTFALPIVFCIAFPTTLMSMRVLTAPTSVFVEKLE